MLAQEMRRVAEDTDQARKLAESIELGTEDIFRDFDLAAFMEHFKLDALEKTIFALAFKLGNRPDLKAKGRPITLQTAPLGLTIAKLFALCSGWNSVDEFPHLSRHSFAA